MYVLACEQFRLSGYTNPPVMLLNSKLIRKTFCEIDCSVLFWWSLLQEYLILDTSWSLLSCCRGICALENSKLQYMYVYTSAVKYFIYDKVSGDVTVSCWAHVRTFDRWTWVVAAETIWSNVGIPYLKGIWYLFTYILFSHTKFHSCVWPCLPCLTATSSARHKRTSLSFFPMY